MVIWDFSLSNTHEQFDRQNKHIDIVVMELHCRCIIQRTDNFLSSGKAFPKFTMSSISLIVEKLFCIGMATSQV